MIDYPYPFAALKSRRLHLGVCGSVAAYKAIELMRGLQKLEVQVSVTLTDAARRFVTSRSFSALGAYRVYEDMFAQDADMAYAHLEPGQMAHTMLIAPATANTLARLAGGFADDMLSAQALAFQGPLLLAPAMNPKMWTHPATQRNIALLTEHGARFISPDSGPVACGEHGQGRLERLDELLAACVRALSPQDMQGKTVLLTLGPTQEAWDTVRVWTNRSTGRMGAALAHAAYARGARVIALAGPGVPWLPRGVERHDVLSARQMHALAKEWWPQADYGIFTAAVADFSPVYESEGKFKKSAAADGLSIPFAPNPDILADLGAAARPDQIILGFAAESTNLEQAAREKLRRKKAHLLAANNITSTDAGFASRDNRLFVCDCKGKEEHWPLLHKAEVAWRLLNWLLHL
ncbi:bifunctional phosphopantothenoylcysteine decarboxylase/phosphopantothenate--cysteine ligase CoaBC [Desulfovibrio sp. OttesenSCG-928-A18]|nr:bifunctional phosphopantothenoylcysteine decarboxylase/phosphopantothenate--cysteine ligase CoaBC [Desulfovibrio sp. OttesenSCG-928-A18]